MAKLTITDVGNSGGRYELKVVTPVGNEQIRVYLSREQIEALHEALEDWLADDEPEDPFECEV